MPEFLIELYVPRSESAAVEESADLARREAEALTSEGTPVRLVRSIYVPDDETCFYLYEAGSLEAVREAAKRAGLHVDRAAEAVAQRKGGTR